MSFQTKNFSYVKKPFGDFINQITGGSKQYLRSLALEKPSQQPAQLAIDFPELASDFNLPTELEMVARNAHSSPLRISGPVVMWLHYDASITPRYLYMMLTHNGKGHGQCSLPDSWIQANPVVPTFRCLIPRHPAWCL